MEVTVGRVVYFWPAHDEKLALPRFGQPLAAHVAAVSEDGLRVNLQVVDANGEAHPRQDVPFLQEGGAVGMSYAAWMPYQLKAAAAAEAQVPATVPVVIRTDPSYYESKEYLDGSSATGIAPLPDISPAMQELDQTAPVPLTPPPAEPESLPYAEPDPVQPAPPAELTSSQADQAPDSSPSEDPAPASE